jgi:hypothetical protein
MIIEGPAVGVVTERADTLNLLPSSSELFFQTDGPIICQALFQRLAPRPPGGFLNINSIFGTIGQPGANPARHVQHGAAVVQ